MILSRLMGWGVFFSFTIVCSFSSSSTNLSPPVINHIPEIDLVYTWIKQPTEDEYHEIITKYCPDPTGNNIQRFRDLNTLYYSIKSVLNYLPWIRTIYLLTNTPNMRPCWLHPSSKIKIIHHHDIWPSDKMHELPTFNSLSIETYLHKIQNLSEYFLYLNDDMFIGRELSPSYFFNLTTMTPHVFVKDLFWLPFELLEEQNFITGRFESFDSIPIPKIEGPSPSSQRFPGSYMGTHGPYIATKSLIHEIHSLWPHYFHQLSTQRCRSANNTQPSSFYSRHSSNSSSIVSNFIPPFRPPFWIYQWYLLVSNISTPIVREIPFLNMFHIPSEFYHKILFSNQQPVDFFILNDDYTTDIKRHLKIDLDITQQQLFLEKYYDFNSINSLSPLEEKNDSNSNNETQKKVKEKVKYYSLSDCFLIRDSNDFTVKQKHNYLHQEKSHFLHSIQSTRNYSQLQLHFLFREIVEHSRDFDEWLQSTPSPPSPVTHDKDWYLSNHSFSHSPSSFSSSAIVEVGHYTDLRQTSFSGPLSFEGMESLSLTTNQRGEPSVTLPLIVYNGIGEDWEESCIEITELIEEQRQLSYPQGGVIVLVRGITQLTRIGLTSNQSTLSLMYQLAQCLRLNYIRGNTNDSIMTDWGIMSSYPLREIRSYELYLRRPSHIASDNRNNTVVWTTPLLVVSIPISISPFWKETQPIESLAYRNTVWVDFWYLMGATRTKVAINHLQKPPLHRLLLSELLEIIKVRQKRRMSESSHLGRPFGGVFVGTVQGATEKSDIGPSIWRALQGIFRHSHKKLHLHSHSCPLASRIRVDEQSNCSELLLLNEDSVLISVERHHPTQLKENESKDQILTSSLRKDCSGERSQVGVRRSHLIRIDLYSP
jgi:hypothetical protein